MGTLVSVRPPRGETVCGGRVEVKKKKRKEKRSGKKIHSIKLPLNQVHVLVFPFQSIEMKLLECDAD